MIRDDTTESQSPMYQNQQSWAKPTDQSEDNQPTITRPHDKEVC